MIIENESNLLLTTINLGIPILNSDGRCFLSDLYSDISHLHSVTKDSGTLISMSLSHGSILFRVEDRRSYLSGFLLKLSLYLEPIARVKHTIENDTASHYDITHQLIRHLVNHHKIFHRPDLSLSSALSLYLPYMTSISEVEEPRSSDRSFRKTSGVSNHNVIGIWNYDGTDIRYVDEPYKNCILGDLQDFDVGMITTLDKLTYDTLHI